MAANYFSDETSHSSFSYGYRAPSSTFDEGSADLSSLVSSLVDDPLATAVQHQDQGDAWVLFGEDATRTMLAPREVAALTVAPGEYLIQGSSPPPRQNDCLRHVIGGPGDQTQINRGMLLGSPPDLLDLNFARVDGPSNVAPSATDRTSHAPASDVHNTHVSESVDGPYTPGDRTLQPDDKKPTGSPRHCRTNKGYQCIYRDCEKAFDCHHQLNTHYRREHKKHRPYHCETCDFRCEAPRELKRHEETSKHAEKTNVPAKKQFACTVDGCTKTYTRSDNLGRHIARCAHGLSEKSAKHSQRTTKRKAPVDVKQDEPVVNEAL